MDDFDESSSRALSNERVSSPTRCKILLAQIAINDGSTPFRQFSFFFCFFRLFSLTRGVDRTSVEDILQILLLFCIESLESEGILLYSERHTLLRVLPVLVVLATSAVKEGDMVFKKLKINRLIRILRVSLVR